MLIYRFPVGSFNSRYHLGIGMLSVLNSRILYLNGEDTTIFITKFGTKWTMTKN